jgi:hypothetical protein
MSNPDFEADVDSVDRLGLIRHTVAGGIAHDERDHVSERLLWAGIAVMALAGLLAAFGLASGAVALTGGSIALVLASLWLRFTRPGSVKPWGAER